MPHGPRTLILGTMCKKKENDWVLPPPACLKKAARHIKHDVCLLQAAYDEQRSSKPAYVAWYTLCRSAFEFFEGKQPPKFENDIMAIQFFDDRRDWEAAKKKAGKRPDDYLDVRNWTNVLAAHLSYSRIGYEGNYDVAPEVPPVAVPLPMLDPEPSVVPGVGAS